MPFLRDDGAPLDELLLAQRPADGYRFEVRDAVVYVDPVSGRRYRAPAAGEGPAPAGVTDLASVPSPLWGFIASYGRQSAPAVLHDAQSLAADALGDPRRALLQRRDDDLVFRRALLEQGVPRMRAWLMWAWVSADRERAYAGAAGLMLLGQVGLGVLVVAASVVLAVLAGPWWLALALVPAVAALPWRGLAPLVLVLTYPLAAFGPLLLAHVVALVPFRLVEAAVEVFTGGDPGSVVRPTVARPRTERP
ncbi:MULTISPECIES: DUF1353 domain-containing protein [unclassified Agromyces]|uniref:DUF1353 domain-containing protein n=1 Tax=unclassified Agromyces TaxID=2639701 RepID=UPI003014202B